MAVWAPKEAARETDGDGERAWVVVDGHLMPHA